MSPAVASLLLGSNSGADEVGIPNFWPARWVYQVSRWMFLGGAVAVSALVLRVGSSFTLGDFLILGSFAALLLTAPRTLPGLTPTPVMIALFFTVLGGALASMVSPLPSASALVLIRMIYLVFLMPWQIRTLFPTTAQMRLPLFATGLGAAACGAATLLQMLVRPDIIPGTEATNADRFPGLANHVSDTGGITSLAVIIGVGLVGRHRFRGSDVLAGAIFVGGLIGVVLSGSVAGMLAAGVGVAVLLAQRALSRSKLLVFAVVAIAGGAVGIALISATANGLSPIARLLQVFGVTSKFQGTDTSASRWLTIELGWQNFGQHPWTGSGLDPFSSVVVADLGVHNLPVALLHGGGVFLALGVLGALAITLARLISVRSEVELAPLCLALILACGAFAITAPSIYNRYLWIPVAISGAVAWSALQARAGRPQAVTGR